ncbi:MAG TPA: hypothetical protein VF064_05045 [Pyrinomonadaceae bacterium]
MPSKPSARALLLLVACACAVSHACARRPQQQPLAADSSPRAQVNETTTPAEGPPPSTTASEEEPPPPAPDPQATSGDANAAATCGLPPPTPGEVGGAVERVFKGAATIDASRRPYFVVGDFNGDSSQDVAVFVRPAPGRLAEINDELANWILVAPSRPAPPRALPYPEVHARASARRRVLVEEADVLLAVIHGHEANGWRDPQATQTYVLKDAAGDKLKTRRRIEVLKARDGEPLPRLRGDVIAEDLGGQPGFLYYDGARYDWYDPRGYKPPAPTRVVHGGAAGSMRH